MFLNLFMFVVSVIGMSHIIVDGSILQSFRDFVKSVSIKWKVEKIGTIVDCYMCSGTWCGFLMGYVWLVYPNYESKALAINVLEVFACGCAGGFLSNFAAVLMNYFEAGTIINMQNDAGPPVPVINNEEDNES